MMAADAPGRDWDEAAQGWHRHADLTGVWLAEATRWMLDAARIGPGGRVLDVAAGAGAQSLEIARRVGAAGHVLATDLSPAILALAERSAREAGLPQIETRLADAQQLRLDGAGFDAAVSRLGLMFCAEPALALQGMHDALRPGGLVALVVFSEPSRNPCIATLLRVARQHAGLPPADPYQPGALMSLGRPGLLESLSAQAGLAEIAVQRLAAPMRLERSADYIAFVRSAGAPIMQLLAPLAPAQQQAAWEAMTAALDAYATAAGWEGPNELLLCSATRPG